MDAAVGKQDLDAILINLAEVPLSEVLLMRDTPLFRAMARNLRLEEDNDDDQLVVARFSNFI